MGYSRKKEIARLKQEHKEAKAYKKRKENVREKLVRFLIVCEGKKQSHTTLKLSSRIISRPFEK